MAKQLDVIGMGAALIEQTAQLRQLPALERTVACAPNYYALTEGGMFGNVLSILSRFGLKVGYIGKIAGDDFGVRLTKSLVNARIDLTQCRIMPLEQSPRGWTLRDDAGQVMRVIFPNILSQIDETYLMACSQYLKSCRLLVVDICGIPLSSCLMATELVKANGIPVILTLTLSVRDIVETLQAGTLRELEELIAYGDALITTIGTGKDLSDYGDPKEMANALHEKYLIPLISIFDERRGSFFESDDEQFFLPAFPTEGAQPRRGGADAFCAGMAHGMAREWPLQETARFAQACSALYGAAGEFSEAAIMQFLAQHPS